MGNSSVRKIVTIGGGTGSFTLLSTFKDYFEDVTAVVNMADDGGSTGILRDELGVLPPGDVRQCLVALSDAPDELRALFNFRFARGSFKGHAFGNVFLSAVETMAGADFNTAVRLAGDVLQIRGQVLPVTTDKVTLELRWRAGETVQGEFAIGHLDFAGRQRPKLQLAPKTQLNPAAATAIATADVVVIAPGNLYGSIAPVLIVPGMRAALAKTKAKIIYVCNLVSMPGQTDGFTVSDYAAEVERFIGQPVLDAVIYNIDQPAPKLMKKYVRAGELPVAFDADALIGKPYRAIGLPLIAAGTSKAPIKNDTTADAIATARSLIRHDAVAVAQAIISY